MKIYVYRESASGDETKNPPTTFCQLVEEKKYFDDDSKEHYGSDWYCEVDNVGDFLTGLQYHENEPITFRHNADVDYYIVYIDDEDAPWGMTFRGCLLFFCLYSMVCEIIDTMEVANLGDVLVGRDEGDGCYVEFAI